MPQTSNDHLPDSPIAPAQDCFPITPDDVNELPKVTKGIYVGTAGDVTCRSYRSEQDVVFRNVPSGYIIDVRIIAVRATGTTASDIIGMA